MSVIDNPPISGTPLPPGPGSPWYSGYDPHGYGAGPAGRPPRRRFRGLLAAGAALAVGAAGAFVGLRDLGVWPAHAVLTTSQIAARVSPGLVDVVSTLGYQQARAAGTGMVLTPSGEVLTNNHVIKGATSITVTDLGDGRSYQASVTGYDQSRDLAVLQLRGASGLTTVTLGNSSAAKVGDKIVALGNAGGKGGAPSVVTGRITGLNTSVTASDGSAGTSEHLTGLISHNAGIQPGDSGGPLVSRTGQVIGVDTAASTGFTFQSGQTRAFAIPVNEAVAVARQIEAGRPSATVHIGPTGFLGVTVLSAADAQANGVPPGSGAAVAGVLAGSPASQAGLAPGDVIVAAGGRGVGSPSDLQAALEPHHPGDGIAISWTDQAGQTHTGTVVLVTGPAA
jgi:S1-C subfamily serine protease